VQKCNAGTYSNCCSSERKGELADVFYAEGRRDFGIVLGKTDFFAGFPTSDFEGRFLERVGFAAGECGMS